MSDPSAQGIITPKKGRRLRSISMVSSIRDSPRSGAQMLGFDNLSQEPESGLELESFEEHKSSEGSQYREVSYGTGGSTSNIEQDMHILEESGFVVDYPGGLLGSGFFGSVYKGHYGPNAQYAKDGKGEPIRNIESGSQFACKVVEFSPDATDDDSLEKRESYEMEKYIMTFANHPNITPIRMAINMGEPRTIPYLHAPQHQYIQHDRVYLIMDWAQNGCLMDFLNKNGGKLKPYQRIKLNRDCFMGLKYLHNNNVFHGDIHLGNVLVFNENGLVAKWTDFGLAFVNSAGQYVWNKFSDRELTSKFRGDIQSLHSILWNCWRGRKRAEESEDETQLCDQFMEMIKEVTTARHMDEIYMKFSHIFDVNPQTREELV